MMEIFTFNYSYESEVYFFNVCNFYSVNTFKKNKTYAMQQNKVQ